MRRPRVSVLLPVRDEEPYLAECLDSLSVQTLEDFEVVAVDDGSTDTTPEILAAHARADARFRVVRQEPAGMVAASERARAEAQADMPAPEVNRPLSQTALFFAAMIAILVFANWGAPATPSGVWQVVYSAKWYLTGAAALLLPPPPGHPPGPGYEPCHHQYASPTAGAERRRRLSRRGCGR